VDLYAGYAETSAKREWTRQTRTLLFSASKAISALCVAKLVDQGYLDWDDLVTKHWPEYGANGKENTTIQHVLSHQAGVPYIEDDLYYEDVSEMQSVLDKLSNATPIWEPGSVSNILLPSNPHLLGQRLSRSNFWLLG
jgi:CubicO group peptidase (beta-lactamase class C family)